MTVVVLVNRGEDIAYLFGCSLLILLACTFVVFDSHITIKLRRFGITQDDFILGALVIYIDPILVTKHVLKLVFCKKKTK